MNFNEMPKSSPENDALAALSRHMYVKHRNIFIGFGVIFASAITTFVVLHSYSSKNRDHLASIRREIQSVTPGTESMFESYHAKLKQRQEEKENIGKQ